MVHLQGASSLLISAAGADYSGGEIVNMTACDSKWLFKDIYAANRNCCHSDLCFTCHFSKRCL